VHCTFAPKVNATVGNACKGARDADACRSSLAALDLANGWDAGMASYPVGSQLVRSIVFTRGDVVGQLATAEEVSAFLGPIDTEKKAQFLLAEIWLIDLSDFEAHPTPSGFDFSVRAGGGKCSYVTEFRFAVSKGGAVTMLERTTVATPDSSCPSV
jgi:hypothetical protein